MSRRPVARDNPRGRSSLPDMPARWQNFDTYPVIGPVNSSFIEGSAVYPLSTTLTVSALIWHEDVLGTGNTQVPFGIGSTSGATNSFIGIRGFNLNMYATLRTTAGYFSAVHAIPAGTIGNYALYHATWDGITLGLWRQGVNVVSTATAGLPKATVSGASVGSMSGGDTCYAMGVVGCGFSQNTTIASPSSHYAACVAANDYVPFSGEQFGYRASDYSGLTSTISPIQTSTPVLSCTAAPSTVSGRWSSFSRITWAT